MSYLFIQTLVIQFFVGIVFLLLGLWGGKFLWGHDRHHAPSSPATGSTGDEPAARKVAPATEDELKKLRMLNNKLEKENKKLRDKIGVETPPSEESDPESQEVAETMEIVEMPVEPDAAGTEPAKPEKAAKAVAKKDGDDLIRIRGIGKVMAEKLEKRGIRTYRKIAEWTKEDIAKLPYGKLVVRDKWQAQARRLHKDKYGDKI